MQVQKFTGDNSLRAIINRPEYSGRFNQVLGERAPQFMSSIISLGASMPDVEPRSIIASCMIAATLDLPIDRNLGFAWVVPYRAKDKTKYAQFQMGYKGYIQLALRTCQYSRLNVCEVYEGELIRYDKFTGDILLDPAQRKSDKVIGYASYLKLSFGFEHAEFWTVADITKHAENYSQAYRAAKKYNDQDSPWIANFDAMAKKTVLGMHIRKWGPMSVQIAQAVKADGGIRRDVGADVEYLDNPNGSVEIEAPPPAAEENEKVAQPADEVPGLEAKAPPTETGAPKEKTPQQDLQEILEKNGVAFDDFRSWLTATGFDRDGDSYPSWNEVPTKTIEAINEAKALPKIIKIYGKGKK